MSPPWCEDCRALHRHDQHFPTWLVWCLDWDETEASASRVHAPDPEDAATRWASDLASEDVSGAMNGVDLMVQGPDGASQLMRLTGEATVDWTAEEVNS